MSAYSFNKQFCRNLSSQVALSVFLNMHTKFVLQGRKFPYKNFRVSQTLESVCVEGRFIFIIVGWVIVDNARRQTV